MKKLETHDQNFIKTLLDNLPQNIEELEYIKIKEWEEKFDREQKAKEHRENLREERLKQRELEKIKSFEKMW